MFKVPRGGHPKFDILVAPPADPDGKDWPMTNLADGKHVADKGDYGLTTEFSKKSDHAQRQSERATFEFTFAEDPDFDWEFVGDGVIFDNSGSHNNSRLDPQVTGGGRTLKLMMKCLTDEREDFKFVFNAQRTPKAGGDPEPVKSEDPSGGTYRSDGG